jgi:hypothetical protein
MNQRGARETTASRRPKETHVSTERPPSRQEWREFLELLTKEHEGDEVKIEVASMDFGDNLQAERLPLAYVAYDDKDDVAIVAVGGRDGRYPVVLRHMIERPRTISVDPATPDAARALDIVGADGTHTYVTLHRVSGRSARV